MPPGGKRAGAGKPKGYKHTKPYAPRVPRPVREEVRAQYEARVQQEIKPLLDATIRASVGAVVMVVKKPGENWRRARSEGEVLEALNATPDAPVAYEIQTLEPDARLLNPIWDRLMGKPAQSLELPEGTDMRGVEITYRIVEAKRLDK